MNDVFFLFAGKGFYPSGGWRDFSGQFDTVEEAVEEAANIGGIDWWHVVKSGPGGSHIVKHGKRDD